ncbi:hypothetical protein EXIGLDRAFT_691391 [Exidia glandulosa HHB12029]|uniref:Uncharacterized protein n=1 Tax=Exidia glandulosa HHB12029 TaxID=1314781 RepID=A0A166MTE2_EXIGL|nr:hypothetical protein EXIGLDRAFT_691391 [Exidia glandulosa HHB12029]
MDTPSCCLRRVPQEFGSDQIEEPGTVVSPYCGSLRSMVPRSLEARVQVAENSKRVERAPPKVTTRAEGERERDGDGALEKCAQCARSGQGILRYDIYLPRTRRTQCAHTAHTLGNVRAHCAHALEMCAHTPGLRARTAHTLEYVRAHLGNVCAH